MGTSNTKPQVSPATDNKLGAPGGNEPYKTIRAKNWAQDDGGDVVATNDIYATKRMGNVAEPPDNPTKPEPKPAQGA